MKCLSARKGLSSTLLPWPSSTGSSFLSSVTPALASSASSSSAFLASPLKATRRPTSKCACSAPSATVSTGRNFQSGRCDCTISKPGAIQSRASNRSSSVAFAAGVAFRPNTVSGSRRGWQLRSSDTRPSPSQNVSVVSHTVPQIGANTL